MATLQFVKRALVSILLELARVYALDLTLSRDSNDNDVKKAFRRVVSLLAQVRFSEDFDGAGDAAPKNSHQCD